MEPDQQPGFDAWAVIELFGHQRIAGRVTEQTIGGATLLRVDVPAVGDRPAFTRFYGAGAIYSLTPSTEAIVRLAVLRIQPEPLNVYLPELKQLTARVPADDRFDDDNDFQIEDDDDPDF